MMTVRWSSDESFIAWSWALWAYLIMISSIFGVAAAKVNSLSESIQSLNPTETLENALKLPPNTVPSNVTSSQSLGPQAPNIAPSQNRIPVPSSNVRSASVPPTARKPYNPNGDGEVAISPPRTLTPTERLKTDEEVPLPDLSGLSPEEQKKILAVLERQSDETASEQQALELVQHVNFKKHFSWLEWSTER